MCLLMAQEVLPRGQQQVSLPSSFLGAQVLQSAVAERNMLACIIKICSADANRMKELINGSFFLC